MLYPGKMEPAERDALRAQMRADPDRFVAQERIAPSTAPALISGRIEPRPTILRSFLVAEDDGYAVMPGGLSRVIRTRDTVTGAGPLGGGVGQGHLGPGLGAGVARDPAAGGRSAGTGRGARE